MKIIISDTAESNLKSIYHYYKSVANIKIARSIKNAILDSIESIPVFSEMYQEEEYLETENSGHRRVISGNYKIIYRIVNKDTIFVSDIFDSRQNPVKIRG